MLYLSTNPSPEPTGPECRCPRCGLKINRHSTAFGEDDPQKDDVTVCVNCCLIMVFNADLSVRKMTGEEWADLDRDVGTEIFKVIAAITGRPFQVNGVDQPIDQDLVNKLRGK